MENQSITTDVVILGGGVAGLWILNHLKKHGYQAVLLEKDALGAGQTTKSQGIIHGGLKYALTGFLSDASEAVAKMPARWQHCLEGTGEIDLRQVKILSPEQLLWSTKSLSSAIAGFFAAKTLASRVKKLEPSRYPTILQHPDFRGTVYQLEEMILDAISLVQTLAKPHFNSLIKTNPNPDYIFHQQSDDSKTLSHLECVSGSQKITLHAKSYVFAAGEGNESLTNLFTPSFPMQRRPLQMTLLKFNNPYHLFAHCIEAGLNPRITITTHPTEDGKIVWYLGGQLAEDGANRTETEHLKIAQAEIKTLFPWIDLSQTEWRSFFVNRAEAKQSNGKRPDSFSIEKEGNAFAVWPTKLALSPMLADELLLQLQKADIVPTLSETSNPLLAHLEKPVIAKPIWDILF
jgi:glycine/D-amino acid oxidase-like deaminating enzyme